jgi:hypothetical protein
MPVSTGSSILASEYNSFRSTLSAIYLTDFGQTLRSTAIAAGVNSVTSAQMLQLYLDSQSVYVHQIGTASASISVPAVGQTVGANASQTYNQATGAKTAPVGGTIQGFNDYDQLIIDVSNFDGSISGWPDTSFSLGTTVTGSRTTNWGTGTATEPTSIYHVVTVTFPSLAARNNYFNAGGELRFSAARTGGAGSKDTDWSNLLAAIGTVKFDQYRVTAGSGTTSSIGNSALTGTYQQIYFKPGSGVYADNDYTIQAQAAATNVLRFRIAFNDGDTGTTGGVAPDFFNNPIDEAVTGTATSNVTTFRPDSSFVYNTVTYTAVDIAAPVIATAVNLSANNATPPA